VDREKIVCRYASCYSSVFGTTSATFLAIIHIYIHTYSKGNSHGSTVKIQQELNSIFTIWIQGQGAKMMLKKEQVLTEILDKEMVKQAN